MKNVILGFVIMVVVMIFTFTIGNTLALWYHNFIPTYLWPESTRFSIVAWTIGSGILGRIGGWIYLTERNRNS